MVVSNEVTTEVSVTLEVPVPVNLLVNLATSTGSPDIVVLTNVLYVVVVSTEFRVPNVVVYEVTNAVVVSNAVVVLLDVAVALEVPRLVMLLVCMVVP